MIEEKLSNFQIDGSIESLIFVLMFHKGNDLSFCFDDVLENYNYNNPFESIEKIAAKFNIVAVSCSNVTIDELKDFNHPAIINISSEPNKKHYIVSFGFNKEHGFIVKDFRNGKYYMAEYAMSTFWVDKQCWVFIS